MTSLVVIAKEPRPGSVKTRLCPPCDPQQAAMVAHRSLAETLDAVAQTCAQRKILCFEGDPRGFEDGFEVIPQASGALGDRLSAVFAELELPAFLIGMDTPQIDPATLEDAMEQLERPDCDAVIGPTYDGGYWGIGMKHFDSAVFHDVPMSTSTTFRAQMTALTRIGLKVTVLRTLRDVDRFEDAIAVAGDIPTTAFAQCVRSISEELVSS